MAEQSFLTPPPSAESDPFYAAAAEGRFLIRRCEECHEAHWYPRARCPFCFGATAWEAASGRGTIYSYSVLRRASPMASIAYVTLAEGPTMMTALVDCDFDALRIGQAVRLVFKPTRSGPPVACFTPS